MRSSETFAATCHGGAVTNGYSNQTQRCAMEARWRMTTQGQTQRCAKEARSETMTRFSETQCASTAPLGRMALRRLVAMTRCHCEPSRFLRSAASSGLLDWLCPASAYAAGFSRFLARVHEKCHCGPSQLLRAATSSGPLGWFCSGFPQ